LKSHLVKFVLLFLFVTNLYSQSDLKKVSVQLEWKHQFEFAGFYAAAEKGYYKDIGLDVELKEFMEGVNISDDVISGKSTFGISSSSLILEKLKNKPVVLLSSFFKQNVLAIVTQENITSVEQLKSKKVMALDWEIEHTSIGLMLKDNNLKPTDFTLVEHDFKVDKFINGEVDAMSVFLTSQPYELNRSGVKYNIFNPANYGIYSYDVELFTNKDFIAKNPTLVKNFVDATNKGWRYAFEHKSEIVDLIYEKYTKRKTKESLEFEAHETEKFFKTNIFKIGSVVSELIKLNTDMYVKLGLANPNYNLEKLFREYIYEYSNYTNKYLDLTQEELAFIRENPVVKIAMLNNFKPFSYVENGFHQGLSNDIIHEISKISGLKFVKVIDTWSPSLKRFQNKEVDMISGISYTKKREEFSLFTKPFFEIPTYIFGQKTDNSYIDLNSLKGKRVGISRDIFYKDSLAKTGINIVEFVGSDQKVDALVLDKIDYFLSSYTSGQKSINTKAITTIKPITEFTDIKKEDLRFGVNKDKKLLYSIMQKSMDKITEEQYSRYINKWIMNLHPQDRKDSSKVYFTEKEKNYLSKKKEIKFCADPSWMPLEGINNGKIDGITSDYVKIFREALGVPFKLVETNSWAQSVEYAKKKKCDILSFLTMETQKRKEYLSFTTPFLSMPLVIATKHDVTFITDFTNLDKKKVGIPKGYAFYDFLKEKYPKMNLVEVENNLDGLTKVKKGELFGFIGTLASVGYLFQTQFVGELKIAGKFDESWKLGIAIREDDPILLNILQKTLDTVSSEEHKSIFNKWIAINYESKVDYQLLWEIIIIAMIVFLIFIYWNQKLRILNSELEFQKNKAQEALKVKSNFLANMTHEIRTPMNVILGMTYLVQKSTQDKKQQEQLKNIESATSSLLRLINDILDSSKIEVGKLSIVNNNFNMDHLLDNIKTVAMANIEVKNIDFVIDYGENLPRYFYGDRLRLEQVLINLVSNATKFTQKGYVRLSIENIKYNKYRFSVKDTGIGVSKEQIENIFEPFTQADDTITRQYGGTGLGLSISKQLVELMGGTLCINSTIQEGTEIYFDIELNQVAQKEDTNDEALDNTKKKIDINLYHKRETITLQREKELISQLQKVVLRKRPNILFPIIEELDKYNLQILSGDDFDKIKIYIKKYMFHEASEILNKYEK
jgi:polar amino acid transport system substrate-binding protein